MQTGSELYPSVHRQIETSDRIDRERGGGPGIAGHHQRPTYAADLDTIRTRPRWLQPFEAPLPPDPGTKPPAT